jgi:predicted amidohydrolase YtcJ
MNPVFPRGGLIAVQDGKIQHVANSDDFKDLRNSKTELIDCHGKTVLPGFIDAHFHFHGFSERLTAIDLSPRNNVRSISDIREKISQISKALPSGTWIRGAGYNEFYLAEKRHPKRSDLDDVVSTHPIKLTHRSGRAHVLNSLALELVDLSKESADPVDGLIDRDLQTGEPTGLLYGMGDHLAKRIPPIDHDQMERGVEIANKQLSSLGITSVHDASPRNNLERWKLIQRWKKQGLLKTRVRMMLGKDGFEEFQKHRFPVQLDKNQVSVQGVKIIVHETTGRLSPAQEELNEMVFDIHRSGLQAILHAIEGKAIEAACGAVAYALKKSPRSDHRHRIEHCSVCTPFLAKRLTSLGIMVVTQPSFIYYNGDRYLKTVPKPNLEHLYPLSTLIKNGVAVAGSSDCPVVPPSPIVGVYAAVSRRTEAEDFVLPDEQITPLEALTMYTRDAAKATFDEEIKGSIEPGKLADLVVLSGDPTKVPANEIKDIEVEMTILDGEVVWDKIS